MIAGESVQPIFLFSLPRSGSTLLQRIIAAHPTIATTSEPWLLLPLLSIFRPEGTYADYSFRRTRAAIQEFVQSLPDGEDHFKAAVRHFALTLYAAACRDDEIYFLDKTPPYTIIAPELVATFPSAKFIFLWRNPLSIVASLIETFGSGKWNVYAYYKELFEGLDRVLQARVTLSERAIDIRYEQLVVEPVEEVRSLCSYLGVTVEPEMTSAFAAVNLEGRFGDKAGVRAYRQISQAPLDKWRETLNNRFRRAWAQRYLLYIGEERLALMGYNLESLLDDLSSSSVGSSSSGDLCRYAYGGLWQVVETHQANVKFRRLLAGRRVYAHN